MCGQGTRMKYFRIVDFRTRGVIYCVGPVNPITGKRNVTTKGIISYEQGTWYGGENKNKKYKILP